MCLNYKHREIHNAEIVSFISKLTEAEGPAGNTRGVYIAKTVVGNPGFMAVYIMFFIHLNPKMFPSHRH